MGTRLSQLGEDEEETQPILSNSAAGIQSNDDGAGSGAASTYSPSIEAISNRSDNFGRTSTRSYRLKPKQKRDVQVSRLPIIFRSPTNNINGYGRLIGTRRQYEEEASRWGFARRLNYFSRLDRRPDSSLAVPDHIVPDDFLVRILVPVKGRQNSVVTIFALWNTMMGTSLLSMPWAILQAGFICGVVLLVAMAFLMFYTSHLVLKSVNFDPDKTFNEFSDVCGYFLGKFARRLAAFSSYVSLLGGGVVYWILLSSFLYRIVLFIRNKADNDSSYNKTGFNSLHLYSNASNQYPDVVCTGNDNSTESGDGPFERFWTENLTVPLLLAAPLFLLVNFKSAVFFTKVNSFGVLSVLFLFSFSVVKAIKWGVHLDLGATIATPDIDPSYTAAFEWTFPALTGISALAYFVQNCVITITRNQEHPENNTRDLSLAYLLVAVTYILIGSLIYITFPLDKSCIKDNFLNNIAATDWLAYFAHIMLFIQMSCVFPLLIFVLRTQILMDVFGSDWPSVKHVVILNVCVFAVCILFALFLPHIGRIIGFVGAFCGLAYAIALPCLVYLVAQHRNGNLTRTSLVIHSLLIVLGVANFISQFVIIGKTS